MLKSSEKDTCLTCHYKYASFVAKGLFSWILYKQLAVDRFHVIVKNKKTTVNDIWMKLTELLTEVLNVARIIWGGCIHCFLCSFCASSTWMWMFMCYIFSSFYIAVYFLMQS